MSQLIDKLLTHELECWEPPWILTTSFGNDYESFLDFVWTQNEYVDNGE